LTERNTARIAGSGSCLPESRLSNIDLFGLDSIRDNFDLERARASLRDAEEAETMAPEEVFDTWAHQVTGIRERRVLEADDGFPTEGLCAEACRRALDDAGMSATDLDLILVASLTGRDEVPNMACTVADMIGAPNLGGYTLNAACAGFVYALATGWSFIASGMAERLVVVSGDALSRITDYSDPKTAVLFGDGAGAVVLTAGEPGNGLIGAPHLTGGYNRAPLFLLGQGWETEEDPVPKLRMGGGPRILRHAISSMAEAAGQALQSAGESWDDVDLVIPHQANLRITRGLEKQLDLKRGRVLHTIENYGNMSASTVAVTLDEALRGVHGTIPDPSLIVLAAIGGGYTSAAAVIRHRR